MSAKSWSPLFSYHDKVGLLNDTETAGSSYSEVNARRMTDRTLVHACPPSQHKRCFRPQLRVTCSALSSSRGLAPTNSVTALITSRGARRLAGVRQTTRKKPGKYQRSEA